MHLIHFTLGGVQTERAFLNTRKWTPIFNAIVAAAHFVHGDVMFLGIPTLSKPAPGAVDFVMDSSSTCSLQTRKQEVIIVSTFKCLFLTNVCCVEGRNTVFIVNLIAKILRNISLRDKREEIIFKHEQKCRERRCLQPLHANYFVKQDLRRSAVFTKYSLSIIWLRTGY